MQLEYEQRQFPNTCVTRARAYERQQLTAEAEQLRAEIAQRACRHDCGTGHAEGEYDR